MTVTAATLRSLLVIVLYGLSMQAASAQAHRSAQSNCVREVERRGYSVVSTSNFQQYRDGWSMDIRARNPRGAISDGSCFVETRSGEVSLSGFGWSGSSNQGLEFTCASDNERYRECQLPVDGRARLVKQRSDSPCIEGRSWGQRGDRVWVSKGCRARFTVERGGWGGSGGTGNQARMETACRRHAERAGMYVQDVRRGEWHSGPRYWQTNVQGVYRERRIEAGCRWYPDRERTEMNFGQGWTTGGGFGGSGGSSGGSVDFATAENACRREAERQGYRVIGQERPLGAQQGYAMQMKLKRASGPPLSGFCRYNTNTRRAILEVN